MYLFALIILLSPIAENNSVKLRWIQLTSYSIEIYQPTVTSKEVIDVLQNVYTIPSDTKKFSKVLAIHLFPKNLKFSRTHGYNVELAELTHYLIHSAS